MLGLRTQWSHYIDQQHQRPSGLIGRVIGERMVRQHAPETAWSIDLLRLRSTDRVLDIGAGAGRGLALALTQLTGGHAIGVDLSATMLHAAAWHNRTARRHGQLSLLRGDIAHLPFGCQQVDKIVSIHTFYFWPDQRVIFQALLSILAPGGRCITTFATARTAPNGERQYWPLHQQAEALVHELQQQPGIKASLASGPDSRQYNNVAIIIEKHAHHHNQAMLQQ